MPSFVVCMPSLEFWCVVIFYGPVYNMHPIFLPLHFAFCFSLKIAVDHNKHCWPKSAALYKIPGSSFPFLYCGVTVDAEAGMTVHSWR